MAGRPIRRARLLAEEVRLRQEEQAALARGQVGWSLRLLAGALLACAIILNLTAQAMVQVTQWMIDKLQRWAVLDLGD